MRRDCLTIIIGLQMLHAGFLLAVGTLRHSQYDGPPTDAQIRDKIIGTWISDGPTWTYGTESYSAHGTITFAANGCYAVKAKIIYDGTNYSEQFDGLWSVKNRILTDTVTNAVGANIDSPLSFKQARVFRLDKRLLGFVAEMDQMHYLERERSVKKSNPKK